MSQTTGYLLYQLIKNTRWEMQKENLSIYLMVKMDIDLKGLLKFLHDHGYVVEKMDLPGVCYHFLFSIPEGDTLYEDVMKAAGEDQPWRYTTYCSLL